MKQISKSGRSILFVATKKQAKSIIAEAIKDIGMPGITELWTGGMLTNFATIRRSIRKMADMNKMANDGTIETLSKKEKLQLSRQRQKLEHQLGSIANMTRLPAAVFVVDITKEHIAISEAHKLNIPTFAIVDTNSDPNRVDFAIPANDDSSTSIRIIVETLVKAIKEGMEERKDAQVSGKHEDGKHDEESASSKYETSEVEEASLTEEEKKTRSAHKAAPPKRGPAGGGQGQYGSQHHGPASRKRDCRGVVEARVGGQAAHFELADQDI